MLGPDVADERVVDHHRQVARHLELVAAADADAVDARDRRLSDLAEAVVGILERAEPLPVLARACRGSRACQLLRSAPTQNARPPGHDEDPDGVVPRRVLGGPRDLAQHAEVERVQHLGPVQRDRRAGRLLGVDDRLEAELGRVARRGMGRLGQLQVAEVHPKRDTHLGRILAGGGELRRPRRRLERIHVGEAPLGRIGERGVAHRASEHRAVAELAAGHRAGTARRARRSGRGRAARRR